VTPDLRAALRLIAEPAPPGTFVPVLREQLLELVDGTGSTAPVPADAPAAPDRLLTVAEVATRCALSRRYIYTHRLPFVVRVGRKVRCSEARLTRWLSNR
jgi:predicted DNA-binding transcriptional regulator AlpA